MQRLWVLTLSLWVGLMATTAGAQDDPSVEADPSASAGDTTSTSSAQTTTPEHPSLDEAGDHAAEGGTSSTPTAPHDATSPDATSPDASDPPAESAVANTPEVHAIPAGHAVRPQAGDQPLRSARALSILEAIERRGSSPVPSILAVPFYELLGDQSYTNLAARRESRPEAPRASVEKPDDEPPPWLSALVWTEPDPGPYPQTDNFPIDTSGGVFGEDGPGCPLR